MAKKPKKLNKNTFAKGALRRASMMWRPISEARRLARKAPNQYMCAICKGLFKDKEVQVDHRNPVVDIKDGWQGWDSYIDRLLCDVDELDVLCKTCHSVKSSHEVSMRKYFRDKKKKENIDISLEEEEP